MCARVHRTRVLHVASHMQQAHLRGLWLGHEGFRVPDGARKSKRDSPTYVGVCVCGCGGGSCPSPLPGSWHRSNWRCESSRHSRDLRAPILADQWSPGGAVTIGQPSYPFGPNHESVLSQGSWPRDRVLSTGFQPGCPSSAGFMVRIQNQLD